MTGTGIGADQTDKLVLKDALESAIHAAPADKTLLRRYFDVLGEISATYQGPLTVHLPGIAHAIRIRCGTDDSAICRGIFLDGWYDHALPASPRHILDLGAHAGFAAIYFANRYPDAHILCVEADTAHYRALLMNTLPYPRIAHLHGAVSATSGWASPLDIGKDRQSRDGGQRFTVEGETLSVGGQPAGGKLRAYGVMQILNQFGWKSADTIKCALSGDEAALFSASTSEWLDSVTTLLISRHKADAPLDVLNAMADAELFEPVQGEGVTMLRRLGAGHSDSRPAPLTLIEVGTLRPVLWDGTEPALSQSCFLDDQAVLIQAGPIGTTPTTLTIRRDFSGQSRLGGVITSSGDPDSLAQLSMIIRRVRDQAVLLESELRLPAGQQTTWKATTPLMQGLHDIRFSLETAADSAPGQSACLRLGHLIADIT
ncbi:O-methyltransferase [Granulibacter bethesdensis]|uniref:O-methyltransferase n=1 Tax=Granulibacter bethesdensis TaxID=364410 RepID=A0AAC9K7X7_9PROT|nr:hypothetical protein [Granulibacter bethesdensis]APH55201.1 O-methyltransferase [Granulibacter bethesdensis]APH62788.1 O-methyltransferase [Granulibacter bethesdensis]